MDPQRIKLAPEEQIRYLCLAVLLTCIIVSYSLSYATYPNQNAELIVNFFSLLFFWVGCPSAHRHCDSYYEG